MPLSSGYSLTIKSVEIFGPYYFIKLFGSINSRKSILQNHFFFYLFFVLGTILLCCTQIKVTSLFPNKAIDFSSDCNKPSALKSIHDSVE